MRKNRRWLQPRRRTGDGWMLKVAGAMTVVLKDAIQRQT
jgi:hypothetical protein